MKILVTGGAGYIGSHTCVELLKDNYDVVVLDNFSNSCQEALNRIQRLANKKLSFYKADLLESPSVRQVFKDHKIDAVIHFAGLKAVGESTCIPLKYYHNNLTGTFNLLSIMGEFNVKTLVFSSSATVYGDPSTLPITETFPLSATNPYGRTKLMIEEILQDLHTSDKDWNIALLRYFNPVGAHESGELGEDPQGLPNNLMPYISQVAVGRLPRLSVFGADYDTPDGTGVRDYIHVTDLALGHIRTLPKLAEKPGVVIYNLGTGNGFSVLEMINGFEKASGQKIAYQVTDRRPGDIAACFADASKAKRELNWEAGKSLDDMCKDTWNWQKKNPIGYRTQPKEE
ncbi:MAG: UDP-glucose 4-epimerase GalE [Proteobacteria bacterium]|nr:UDP-glucose 4-epimerase GalE [Desulfobacula sp.]MBU3952873.1 UDP-glucose 4-epimerase GalE [Pseudomonadota bacterium]MBU4130174.1 UDP-glucose 4-epimerase GalE [Pseudomonadota bacterium]